MSSTLRNNEVMNDTYNNNCRDFNNPSSTNLMPKEAQGFSGCGSFAHNSSINNKDGNGSNNDGCIDFNTDYVDEIIRKGIKVEYHPSEAALADALMNKAAKVDGRHQCHYHDGYGHPCSLNEGDPLPIDDAWDAIYMAAELEALSFCTNHYKRHAYDNNNPNKGEILRQKDKYYSRLQIVGIARRQENLRMVKKAEGLKPHQAFFLKYSAQSKKKNQYVAPPKSLPTKTPMKNAPIVNVPKSSPVSPIILSYPPVSPVASRDASPVASPVRASPSGIYTPPISVHSSPVSCPASPAIVVAQTPKELREENARIFVNTRQEHLWLSKHEDVLLFCSSKAAEKHEELETRFKSLFDDMEKRDVFLPNECDALMQDYTASITFMKDYITAS